MLTEDPGIAGGHETWYESWQPAALPPSEQHHHSLAREPRSCWENRFAFTSARLFHPLPSTAEPRLAGAARRTVPGGSVTVGGWSVPSPGFCTLLGTPSEGLQPFPQAGMAPLRWPLMAGLVGSTPGTGFSGDLNAIPDSPGMSSPWFCHPDPGTASLCHWLG